MTLRALLISLSPAVLLAACGGSSTAPDAAAQSGTTNPGGGNGNTATARANDDFFTVQQDSADNLLDVLDNDSGSEGVDINDFPDNTAAGGTLSVTPEQTLSYTPPAGYAGADSFEYSIRSGEAMDNAQVDIVVQGNSPPPVSAAPCRNVQDRLNAGAGYCFDAFFNTTHDSTRIDMTVYVPHPDRLGSIPCPGATSQAGCATVADGDLGYAPLVIHSHGFGGAKNSDFSADPEHFVDNQTAQRLWNMGYFVISFSQRGFGQSGGEIGLMTRNLEGLDHNELVDWAIKHLRGESTDGANDSIYDFEFDQTNPEHISSEAVADTRPSLLMNDDKTRLIPTARDETGDPGLGLLGYSYGGGWQYTASAADTLETGGRAGLERFDALIPEGTWHDLRYSLHANNTPKGYWITLLFSFAVQGGTGSNGEPTPVLINQAFGEAQSRNRVNATIQNTLGRNGASDYCDETNGVPTDAALFHIQGVRDTLFDFADGYDSALCFERAGNDTRLLLVSGGHPYTITQQPPYTGNTTSMDIDEIVHCDLEFDADGDGDIGQERLSVTEMMVDWFEDKLRGEPNAADYIPAVCMAQPNTDPDDMLEDDRFNPAGDPNFRYLKEGVTLDSVEDILVGAGSSPSYVCDNGTSATCDVGEVALNLGGSADANMEQFVPVYTVPDGESRVMAGIPTADFDMAGRAADLSGAAVDPIVFVGMGLMRNGELVTLHDQIMPIRDTATYPWAAVQEPGDMETVENSHDGGTTPYYYGCSPNAEMLCERGRLAGVSVRLLPGDQVGPLFSSADAQYPRTMNTPAQVTITGNVELPIYPPSNLPPSNN